MYPCQKRRAPIRFCSYETTANSAALTEMKRLVCISSGMEVSTFAESHPSILPPLHLGVTTHSVPSGITIRAAFHEFYGTTTTGQTQQLTDLHTLKQTYAERLQ